MLHASWREPWLLVSHRIARSIACCRAFALVACVVAQSRANRSPKAFASRRKSSSATKKQPVSETTTLFLDGVVYDFLDKPEQTAVFRKPSGGKPGRFILLNDEQRIRTEISTEQVAGAMDKLRTWAGQQTIRS